MIEVKSLTKSFGKKRVVENVSFSVERGEVLGFLGPNGAGKSTTMRMITGFYPPTEGEVMVDGVRVQEEPIFAQRKIGYLPESAPLYNDMTVTTFLHFAAEMRGLYGGKKKEAVERAIEMCFLQSVRHQSIDTLSKGFRHRTCFAQSIIHDPEILVLDEPTDGLDPNQKHEVRQLIRRMGESKAIIFSTHILEEVDAACSRAIIIDRGKIVADGTPDALRAKSADSNSISLCIEGGESSTVKQALLQLNGVVHVEKYTDTGKALFKGEVQVKSPKISSSCRKAISALCKERNWDLIEMHVEEGKLDEFFRAVTRSETEGV